MTGVPRGRFCWYELMTTDPDAAKRFYTSVTGWGTQDWDGGDMPYTMWMTGETPVGGVMELPPDAREAGAPTHWIAYVSTPDADATIARAKERGASLVWGPMDLPEVGRVAGLADPQGAHFAVHQPAGEAPGSDAPASTGQFSWHELATPDWPGAWEFYSDLFDWQKAEAMDMGEMGTYQTFGRGAHPVGAMFTQPPQIPMPFWMLYILVEDLDGALSRVRELGGQVMNGPEEVPGGDRIAQCMDPQGGAFALHERG